MFVYSEKNVKYIQALGEWKAEFMSSYSNH